MAKLGGKFDLLTSLMVVGKHRAKLSVSLNKWLVLKACNMFLTILGTNKLAIECFQIHPKRKVYCTVVMSNFV